MMPALLRSPRSLRLQMILLTAAVATLLLAPMPFDPASQRFPALWDELENLGHPLVFALLVHVGFRLLRASQPAATPGPYLVTMLVAAGFGLATEILQRFVGRDSAWIDLANDVLGASFGLLLVARREFRSPWLAGMAAAGIALLATGPFLWTAAAYGFRSMQAPVLWRPDAVLLRRFSHWQHGAYAGLVIDEPLADWSGYGTLIVEVRNLRNVASLVSIRVHDRLHDLAHEDRYNSEFELPARSLTTLHIPLEQIRLAPRGRPMDMTAIRSIIVFQTAASELPLFVIDQIRLE